MAWTTPRSWTPGETVTASIFNQHIRDQMVYLKLSPPDKGFGASCTLARSANQTISTATWTKIQCDTVVYDPEGWQSSDTYGMDLPAGVYWCTIGMMWASNATGARYASAYEAGPTYHVISYMGNVSAMTYSRSGASGLLYLATAKTIHLYGYQSSGGNLDFQGNSSYTYANHFGVTRIMEL